MKLYHQYQIIIIKLFAVTQSSMRNYNLVHHDQYIDSKYFLQNSNDHNVAKNYHHKQKLKELLNQSSHYQKQQAYKSPKNQPKSKSKTPNNKRFSKYDQSLFASEIRDVYHKGDQNYMNTDSKNVKTKRQSDNRIVSKNNKYGQLSTTNMANEHILRISKKSPFKYQTKNERSNILSPKNTNKQIERSPNKIYLNLSNIDSKHTDKTNYKINLNLSKANYDQQVIKNRPATCRQNIKQQKQLEWKRIYQKIYKLDGKQKKNSKKKSIQRKEGFKNNKIEQIEDLKGYLTPLSINYLKNSNLDNLSKIGTSEQPKFLKTNSKVNNKTQSNDLHHSNNNQFLSQNQKKKMQRSLIFQSKPEIKTSFIKKENQSIYQSYLETDYNTKKSIKDSESTTHPIAQQKDISDFQIPKYQSSRSKKHLSIKDFKLGPCKGQGKFGQVYLATHIATTTIYALKKISKLQIKQNSMETQLILQVKLQYFCNHPNILKLYGFFDDQNYVYLILQYMEQGTLFDNLKKKKSKKLTQMEVSRRVCEMANAVTYLHDLDVAHRDIKPQNIVLSHGTGKLCDFGWATICYTRRKTYCGTFDYVAPEILQGKQYDECVDLWCLGVLTYQLLIGKVPFYNVSRKQTMKKILTIDKNELYFPNQISQQAKDFIESLVIKQPYLRMKAYEILKHPFIGKYYQLHLYK